jgi:lysophospholipase L1-like esterase
VTATLNRPDKYATILGLATSAGFESSTGKFYPGNSTVALDFILYGDTVEFGWVCQTSGGETFQIFVDGQPLSASSVHPSGISTTAGGTYYCKLVFAAAGQHRITAYGAVLNAFPSVGTPITGYMTPAPRKPKIAIIGDSWLGGAAPTSNDPLLQYSMPIARVLGADVLQAGVGGTGYLTTQNYGGTARIAQVQAFQPDVIVFQGSRNDGGTSGLAAAAASCYAAYASAFPNAAQIVFGVQPGSAAETVGSTFAAMNKVLRDTALATPNVVAFHDMLGTAVTGTAPTAYSAGTTYNEGDLVAYNGAVWRWSNAGNASAAPAGNPGSGTAKWVRQTWAFTGTGNAGATTGDGSRDVLLGSDGIHPTPAGELALGLWMAQVIKDDIAALVAA